MGCQPYYPGIDPGTYGMSVLDVTPRPPLTVVILDFRYFRFWSPIRESCHLVLYAKNLLALTCKILHVSLVDIRSSWILRFTRGEFGCTVRVHVGWALEYMLRIWLGLCFMRVKRKCFMQFIRVHLTMLLCMWSLKMSFIIHTDSLSLDLFFLHVGPLQEFR